jgi:ATP-binding protein involved in chromosome partitioning
MTRQIRTYNEVGPGGATIPEQVTAQRERLTQRLAGIRAVVAIASGKGGVGKSAITANLASFLSSQGLRVGALDSDLNGPSLARMLGVVGERLGASEAGIVPPVGAGGVRVVSMELFQDGADAPLRWRGPEADGWVWRNVLETGTMRELLSDVAWGELDLLLVDVAPGTDRIARLLDLVPDPDAMLLVTTPSEMARRVVARSLRLAREARLRRIGLIENMTAWSCPECGARTELYESAGPELDTDGVERWGEIPFDPRLARSTDEGQPFVLAQPDAPAARAVRALAERLRTELEL